MDAKTTGAIIAQRRKAMGLNQTQLAELLNVSNRTVSKWENGDGFPDITLLPEISKVLSVSIDELLTGKESQHKAKEAPVKSTQNLFHILYALSLILGIFSAVLGVVTEIYSIWAFPVLFYTHWEIIFVAVSLFTTVLSAMLFSVGIIRLHVEYSKKEIILKAEKKGLILAGVLMLFPLSFAARIIDFSRWGNYTVYIMALLILITVSIGILISRKSGEKK